jgi:hypothetical protein
MWASRDVHRRPKRRRGMARLDSQETRQLGRVLRSVRHAARPRRLDAGDLRSRRKRPPKSDRWPTFHFRPPLGTGRTRFTSHLRRQISSNFHARANFDDDWGTPRHESNSLRLSPRGSFLSHDQRLAPFIRRVTSFERAGGEPPERRFRRERRASTSPKPKRARRGRHAAPSSGAITDNSQAAIWQRRGVLSKP